MSGSYCVSFFRGVIRSGQGARDVSRQLEALLNGRDGLDQFTVFAAVNVRVEPGCLAGLLGRNVAYDELDQILFAPAARARTAEGTLTARMSTTTIDERTEDPTHSSSIASSAALPVSVPAAKSASDGAAVNEPLRRWPKATLPIGIVVAAVLAYGYVRSDRPSTPPPVAVEAARPAVTQAPPNARVLPQPAASPTRLSADTVQTPPVHVGDRWVTDTTDSQDAKLSYRSERVVTEMPEGRIVTTVRNLKSKYTRTVEYDRQWSLLSARQPTGATTTYSPAIQYLRFPAKPGDSWRVESTETSSTGELKTHSIAASVDGWEMVTVPAGTFRALKIVLHDDLRDKGAVVQQGEDVSWYVPNVRRTVKTEESSYNPSTGERRRRSIVLVEYSVQR